MLRTKTSHFAGRSKVRYVRGIVPQVEYPILASIVLDLIPPCEDSDNIALDALLGVDFHKRLDQTGLPLLSSVGE